MKDCSLICFGCMGELSTPAQVCPHCGWNNVKRSNGIGYLADSVLENQYFVGKVLGHGGFGVTYIGYDLNLRRRIAIKEYYPRELAFRDTSDITMYSYPDYAADFKRGCERALDEGRAIARVRNTLNIVQVHNAFPANGTVYTIMEYIPGKTLSGIVEERGRMNWREAYELMRPIMVSLGMIHEENLIHRDVSPDNIMINSRTGIPVLLDFGAAHMYQGVKGHSYSLRPGYAPAEQYSGITEQDGRTDEYALCATMYFLLSGQKPMDATQRAFGDAPMNPPSKFAPEIPTEFEKVLLKGMAVRMADRYPSMRALTEAFDQVAARPAPSISAKKADGNRRSKMKGILAGCVLIAAALVVVLLSAAGVFTDDGQAKPTQMPTQAHAATPAPDGYGVLRSDVKYRADGMIDISNMKYVMGTEIKREEVAAVTFVDTLADMGGNAVDVSQNADGGVMMWYTQDADGFYQLYFGAQGRVMLPADCTGLFANYSNMISLCFGDSVDTASMTSMRYMFYKCGSLSQVDLSGINTHRVTDMGYLFCKCSSLKALDLKCFDTHGVTDMSGMFYDCSGLEYVQLGAFDTQKVQNMASMFEGCGKLGQLELSSFDTRGVQRMSKMFYLCGDLTQITVGHDFRIPEDSEQIFGGCGTEVLTYPAYAAKQRVLASDVVYNQSGTVNAQKMKYVMGSELERRLVATITFTDTLQHMGANAVNVAQNEDGVVMMWYEVRRDGLYDLYFGTRGRIILPENCERLFAEYSNLTAVRFNDVVDASNVTNMSHMFRSCSSLEALDLRGFDTRKVTDMRWMFYNCSSLEQLDVSELKTGTVTHMERMFSGCGKIAELDLSSFDTGDVLSMNRMFLGCASLNQLDLSSFDTGRVTDMQSMFCNCTKIRKIIVGTGFKIPQDNSSDMFTGCGIRNLTYN